LDIATHQLMTGSQMEISLLTEQINEILTQEKNRVKTLRKRLKEEFPELVFVRQRCGRKRATGNKYKSIA
jgi:hypothetical protein